MGTVVSASRATTSRRNKVHCSWMVSAAQEDLCKLCKRLGPRGGSYVVPGTAPVYAYLRRYRYTDNELRIIRDNIIALADKAEREGIIPEVVADEQAWTSGGSGDFHS